MKPREVLGEHTIIEQASRNHQADAEDNSWAY